MADQFTIGAMADSAFEYFLKQYLLVNQTEPESLELYMRTMQGVIDHSFTTLSPDERAAKENRVSDVWSQTREGLIDLFVEHCGSREEAREYVDSKLMRYALATILAAYILNRARIAAILDLWLHSLPSRGLFLHPTKTGRTEVSVLAAKRQTSLPQPTAHQIRKRRNNESLAHLLRQFSQGFVQCPACIIRSAVEALEYRLG